MYEDVYLQKKTIGFFDLRLQPSENIDLKKGGAKTCMTVNAGFAI